MHIVQDVQSERQSEISPSYEFVVDVFQEGQL